MDDLPIEVLRWMLSLLDLKTKFVLMRVSRRFEAACRSLVAEQRVLEVNPRRHPMYFWNSVTRITAPCRDESRPQMWLSLAKMKMLTDVEVNGDCHFARGVAEAMAGALAASAGHLQMLQFTDLRYRPVVLDASHTWLREIPFPKLRVMRKCREEDVAFLVQHSPLLQHISVDIRKTSLTDVKSLSQLTQLEVVEFHLRDYDAANRLAMLLLRGSSRQKLQRIIATTGVYADWTEAVEREVQLINQKTGQRLFLRMKVYQDDSD